MTPNERTELATAIRHHGAAGVAGGVVLLVVSGLLMLFGVVPADRLMLAGLPPLLAVLTTINGIAIVLVRQAVRRRMYRRALKVALARHERIKQAGGRGGRR